MSYKLVWNRETIEDGLTIDEARYLQGEYVMAYKGSVQIVQER